ncbi:hypothetical protein [Roseibium litorale]|uniref:Secreted protein n=1 Tax=Roseibium litorale TaxID=2803841 RepID=A0ABR9CH56_9HYPH|nr:hypothetical protein [Roseibium litorale]MBD8890194.1 hypothetical protein [Roseibium litorale]
MKALSRKMARTVRLPVLLLCCLAGTADGVFAFTNGGMTPELAQAMSRSPERFSSLLCQQLRYLEAKVLAAGRICQRSDRARRSFPDARSCLSPDEDILPGPAKDYLVLLRQTIDAKGCKPW